MSKVAFWDMYSALITAYEKGFPDQQTIALPTFNPVDNTELEIYQYLSALSNVLWQGKIWSPQTKSILIEVLYYIKNELYRWYRNEQWPIAQRLATISQFLVVLDSASTYQANPKNQECSQALERSLGLIRLDLNQWALQLNNDIDQTVRTASGFIKALCE